MCAINGIYNFRENKNSESIIKKMCESMRYRGPDDMDLFSDDTVCLGQDRLSIIGVSNGHQPIFNENKTLAIICNGEIYNYKELREELKNNGHNFTTDSDTEVVLHLYEEKKEKALDELRGMFAFAIYDLVKKELFLARDINGKKPLYYSVTPKGVVFSSELLSIKNFFLSDYSLDWNEMKNYLKFSFGQSMTDTYIKEIKKLENASYMIINNESIINKRYWKKTNTVTYKKSYEEAKKECLDILRESVNLRLRSDVPLAILLSGGVDSSLIAALSAESGLKIHAITAGYKGQHDCDERAVAKRFAEEKGLIWHEIELDEADYESYFYEYINYIDEPVSDLASIAKWGIYKKAKELGFKVLLSGDGSDELFYGYKSHNKTGEVLDFLYDYSEQKGKRAKIKNLLNSNSKNLLEYLKGNASVTHYRNFYYQGYDDLRQELNNLDFDYEMENNSLNYYNDDKTGVDKIYNSLFNLWLPNNCYYLADKLAMGNSIEGRCPFADQKLIDFVSSLPLDYKFRNNFPKGFLKDIASELLPEYILNPVKRGFTPPMTAFNSLFTNYKNSYFNKELKYYNQLVVDYFIGKKLGITK